MKFSIALPTCTEGLSCPVPFVNTQQMVQIAVLAEKLGYDSVWGNDHLSTQAYVKATYPDPPNYYEVLITLTYIAAKTARLRLGTGILVLPMREPVLVAKQLSTLDQFSGGRLSIGVGVGAYREEFESVYPERQVQRGPMLEESLSALRTLLTERDASFAGKYFKFRGVESYPKPLQHPLPVYIAGNSRKAVERAAQWGEGWMPASLPLDDMAAEVRRLGELAEHAGRDLSNIDVAPQFSIALGSTHEKAERTFKASQGYRHLLSLQQSTMKDVAESEYLECNLIGTPQDVIEKIGRFQEAGMTHCAAMCFDTNTVDEMIEQMEYFARDVMPAFA
jgi:probable F420-dependent oxidoreductase